jgi:Protein of unknown function (DUF3443)
MRSSRLGAWILMACLTACGGSGGGGSSSSPPPVVVTPPVVQANSMAVTIDAGPAALNGGVANLLYASVTICTPGSTTACQTIDHVQVDTGSTGLRILASALGAATPTTIAEPTTGRPLLECAQFADGFSWGTVKSADVTLGPRKIPSLAIQIIGDAAAGAPPTGCQVGPEEDTVGDFGANGVLGIGNFLQDCGLACQQRAVDGTYYTCTSSTAASCAATIVALTRQLQNPVSALSTDNNGVLLSLPSVPEPGSPTLNGTLVFGVATQTDNALGTATVFKLNTAGEFTTVSSGVNYPGSFIDSGSNAYFFASSIRTCPDASFFYCPITGTSTPASLALIGSITGTNGAVANINFTVDNADQVLSGSNFAFPGLAGPNGSVTAGTGGAFDWGIAFFFGRPVFVVIEGSTVGGVAGPAVAF